MVDVDKYNVSQTRNAEGMIVPAYIHCPHCDHPVVLTSVELGQRYRCRQCHRLYVVRRDSDSSVVVDIWRRDREMKGSA
ncbi:MAG: hypothetical protein MI923_13075 [Phycisphaerales bacterium]|nr:hypothetical protein [Phycisphaerales bacterium]